MADAVAAKERCPRLHRGAPDLPLEEASALTDRDIVLGVVAPNDRTPDRTTVGEVMASELLTMEESRDLTDALMLMRSAGIRRIPVVNEEGGLEGIIAFDDFLEYLSEELGDLAALLLREQRREREVRGEPRSGARPG